MRAGGTDSRDSCEPTSTGWVYYFSSPHGSGYNRSGPELHYGASSGGTAYAKFDIAPIPDRSTILNAQLLCYQYQVNSTPVRAGCTHPGLDPDSASNEHVHTAIMNCHVLAETSFSKIGWVEYDLGGQGVAILQGRLQLDWLTLGIMPVAGEATSYGSNGDDRHTRLRVVYAKPNEADIRVVRAEPPCPLTRTAHNALLVLSNEGPGPSEPSRVYATSPGLCPKSALVGAIPVGETACVKLPLPIPDSTDTRADYTLWATYADDPRPDDNSAQLNCWVLPANTYAAEGFDKPGFPPDGWVVQDNDGRSQRWERRSDSSVIHSGAGFAGCARELSVSNDDWLISGPICPRRDQPDSLGFFCRTYLGSSLLQLQTWAMRGQNMADTTRRLMTEWVSDPVYLRRSVSLDTFDGDTIYVGFRCQSSGSFDRLCLDDIWFSGFVPPDTSDTSDTTDTTVTPKPPRDVVQRTTTKLPDFAFAPNPSGKRVVTVRSALAVGKRRALTMRDVVGRAVRTFALDPSGVARLDLRGLAPGVYMATLDAGTQSITRKLVLTAR